MNNDICVIQFASSKNYVYGKEAYIFQLNKEFIVKKIFDLLEDCEYGYYLVEKRYRNLLGEYAYVVYDLELQFDNYNYYLAIVSLLDFENFKLSRG